MHSSIVVVLASSRYTCMFGYRANSMPVSVPSSQPAVPSTAGASIGLACYFAVVSSKRYRASGKANHAIYTVVVRSTVGIAETASAV